MILFEEITNYQLTWAMPIIHIDNDQAQALLNRHAELGISFEAAEDESSS